MNLKDLNIVFAGCVQNCSKYLKKSLSNINQYSQLFKDSYRIIIENGSKDNTKLILRENLKVTDYFIEKEDLNNFRFRGERLERARNFIIDKIKNEENLKNSDLLIIIDLDDIGAYEVKNEELIKAIKFLYSKTEIAGVFANQLGIYYDMWTLRHRNYCKEDIWAETFKILMKSKNALEDLSKDNFQMAQNYLDKKRFYFNKDDLPIKVDSAFGGFGIYKIDYILKNKRRYEGSQQVEIISKDDKRAIVNYQRCEHVNFNLGLLDLGCELYILPYLINREYLDGSFPSKDALNLIMS